MSETRLRLSVWALALAVAAVIGHGASRADESSPAENAPREVPFADSAAAAHLVVEQVGDRVAYQVLRQREFPPGYTSDIQLEALLAWGEATGQPGYLEFVRQVSQERKFWPGYTFHSYRLQMFSNLPFELYKRFKNPEYVGPFLSETRKYQAEALRAYDGLVSYYFPEWAADSTPGVGVSYLDPKLTPVLIDNAQEYASRLAKAGALSGDTTYFRDSADQIERLRKAFRDSETGLWNHGRGYSGSAQTVTTPKWGRAQAWILRGMVESLSYLPRNSPERQRVALVLSELAQTLVRYQDSQGFWHEVVDRPDSYQETSSTAFISYYFARAVRQGLLAEKPYRAASTKAFEGLTRDKVSADGVVYGTCERTPPLATVDQYLRRSTPVNDPHG